MSTPPRLVHLQCPMCQTQHWEIDCDWRGMVPSEEIPYAKRSYRCPACERTGAGYAVSEQSPPAFFLQPHSMCPMSSDEFDHWARVFRENFPDHPKLQRLGVDWYVDAPRHTAFLGSIFLRIVVRRLRFWGS